jgi:ubiquinone/menaquinone biosynthesis C-methylase UbiE
VVGVDLSGAMLIRARRRFRRDVELSRLRLEHSSADDLRFGDAGFDGVVSVASLYFWPRPAAALAEFARVLRPGGRLVLVYEPAAELRKWPGHRFGFHLFEQAEVEALVEAAGFRIDAVDTGYGRKPDRFLGLSATRRGANG